MARNPQKPIPPSGTSQLFAGGRKSNDRGASVTRERLENDLAEFRKAGGHIQVLGNTRVLTRVDAVDEPAAEAVATKPPAKKRG